MRRDPSLTQSAFYDNGAMLTVVEVKVFKSLKPLKSNSFLDEAFGFIDICGANLFISAKPNPAYSVKIKVQVKVKSGVDVDFDVAVD
jgi:hypothetical protein